MNTLAESATVAAASIDVGTEGRIASRSSSATNHRLIAYSLSAKKITKIG